MPDTRIYNFIYIYNYNKCSLERKKVILSHTLLGLLAGFAYLSFNKLFNLTWYTPCSIQGFSLLILIFLSVSFNTLFLQKWSFTILCLIYFIDFGWRHCWISSIGAQSLHVGWSLIMGLRIQNSVLNKNQCLLCLYFRLYLYGLSCSSTSPLFYPVCFLRCHLLHL